VQNSDSKQEEVTFLDGVYCITVTFNSLEVCIVQYCDS